MLQVLIRTKQLDGPEVTDAIATKTLTELSVYLDERTMKKFNKEVDS